MSHLIIVGLGALAACLAICGCAGAPPAAGGPSPGGPTGGSRFERDAFETSAGQLSVTFVGHGTLVLEWGGTVIHVDPYGKLADYATFAKADLIVVTHHHGDHLDTDAIGKIRTDATAVVCTQKCADALPDGIIMANGEEKTVAGVPIRAVPAYNLVHTRPSGEPFHPTGEGNGYVLTFGATKVYVAGDTENVPEMATLQGIDIAFLPMNLPYTMTPQMAADAARAFMPKTLYPYHFGRTDCGELITLLKDTPRIEVRIRKME